MGSGVTSIGDSAFSGCTSLKSIVIPYRTTSIGQDAFYNCSSLEKVYMGENVTSIGLAAFYDCKSLVSITIPDGVTVIDNFTFYNCSSLQIVTVGTGVTAVNDCAFLGCVSLWHVLFKGTEEAWDAITLADGNETLRYVQRHYNCSGYEVIDTENKICPICEAENQYAWGDVNCDGWTDVEDAMMILQYEVGLLDDSDLYLTVGDVSGDGWVDVEDAMLILQYEVGLVEQFPVEEASANATSLDFQPAVFAIPRKLELC